MEYEIGFSLNWVIKMIYEIGNQQPTAKQKRITLAIADASFCTTLPNDFGMVPCGRAWMHDRTTCTAIKMKCVEPHKDDWVGSGRRPRRYAAFFWLVDVRDYESVIVQVGTEAHRMVGGDFLVFDDRVLHSVFARRVWRGIAYQVRCNTGKPDNSASVASYTARLNTCLET